MAATPIDIWVEIRTPARITGHASGSRTWNSDFASLIPIPRADSTRSALTPCSPTTALRSTGKTA